MRVWRVPGTGRRREEELVEKNIVRDRQKTTLGRLSILGSSYQFLTASDLSAGVDDVYTGPVSPRVIVLGIFGVAFPDVMA